MLQEEAKNNISPLLTGTRRKGKICEKSRQVSEQILRCFLFQAAKERRTGLSVLFFQNTAVRIFAKDSLLCQHGALYRKPVYSFAGGPFQKAEMMQQNPLAFTLPLAKHHLREA